MTYDMIFISLIENVSILFVLLKRLVLIYVLDSFPNP